MADSHTFAWWSTRIPGSSRVELVGKVVLPLIVVGHIRRGHVIVHGRETLGDALVAERHYIIFIVIRIRSKCEHVLAAAERQAAGSIKVMLYVLWAVEVAGNLECRLAE